MNKLALLRALRAGVAPVALGAAALAAPAFAQDTAPAQQQETAPTGPATAVPNPAPADGQQPGDSNASAQGDVVVTGSRIPQPNLTAASPVTVVNNQDFKLQGTTRVEDLLNTLPQVFADQGGSVSNGATGTATVNLRNLGANRTLVLVNGRRLVPGDPTDSAADINFIPATIIKRVDVLTGGASATYGADAVGGVVNFILDTDFTGFKLDGQYSFDQHDNHAISAFRSALANANIGAPDGPTTDGGTVDTTAVFGASFDDNRGHITAYAGYRKIGAITQDRRDYSACALAASKAGALSCGGSATSANGTVVSFTGGAPGDIVTDPVTKRQVNVPFGNGTSTYFQVGPNRTLLGGYTPYNFAPTNYYQRPDERYTAGFFAHYDVSDAFKPYLEGQFMDDRSVAQIAPSGDFGNTYSINCDNPLLSAQQRAVICDAGNLIARTVNTLPGAAPGTFTYTTSAPAYSSSAVVASVTGNAKNFGLTPGVPADAFQPFTVTNTATGGTYQKGFAQIYKRNVEGTPRQDDLQHTDFRIVAGTRGDLNKAFSYDAYYQYGRTNFAETYLNDFSITRLGRALDVVSVNGVATCRSVVDGSDPNCVPYNIFTAGGVTPAATAYLATPGFQRAQVTEQIASGNITGLLGQYGIQSPLADDGVGLNVGFEYRKEALNLNTDVEFQTGDLAGQGAATLPISGSFRVYEGYGELRVPLVHEHLVYDAFIEGGYRRSHYDVAGNGTNTDTYKIDGEIAPIRSVRFRGAYNRAVRSPNIQEFFAPNRIQLDGATDPCSDRVLTAADTGCLAQGLRVGQFVASNPASQYNGFTGGNANLTPEKADTYTAGIVLQPDFIPVLRNLAITVDYFNIKVKNEVASIGADTIVQSCTGDAASPLCGLIHRDSTGSLWRSADGYVIDTTQNIGGLKTSGIDVGASYAHEVGSFGSLSAGFNGTWLDELIINNGVSTPYNCAKYYGTQCGTPSPTWKHKARLTFTLPDGIGLSGQWRYFGPVKIDASSNNPTLNPISTQTGLPSNNFTSFNSRIHAQNYFDLTLTAVVGEHYNFRLGVQNILDKDPPLVAQSGAYAQPAGFQNGNTYPQVYDALGRYIYAGVTLDF